MVLLGAWVAVLIPWLLGAVVLRTSCFTSGAGSVAASIGYGFFAALIPAVGLFALQGHLGWDLNPWPIAVAFLSLLVLALWRALGSSPLRPTAVSWDALVSSGRWSRMLVVALMVWVGIRVATLVFAASTYPLFPWDAWTTWALRAKVWTELGQWVPFFAPDVWIQDVDGVSRTMAAWHYPELPSWISAWAATASGGWNEQAANMPWVGALLALLAAAFGQARRWGASIVTAWVMVWMLVSIPLVGSHVALAGYIDLWVAACLGLAFMAFLFWVRDRQLSQLVLAVLFVAMTVFLKKEALVWVLLFLPAWLASRAPSRVLWLLPVAGLLLVLALFQSGGFTLRLPILGEFAFTSGGEWRWVLLHGFVFGNWHLFGYLVVALIIFGMIEMMRGCAEPWLRSGIIWTFGALFSFYVLFFWTAAAEWAVDGTSLNRILLQFTPAMLFLMMALWTSRMTPKESQSDDAG